MPGSFHSVVACVCALTVAGSAYAQGDTAGLQIGPPRLDFGVQLIETQASQTVELANTGSLALRLTRPQLPPPFSVAGGSCGTGETVILPPGGRCTLAITYAPTTASAAQAVIDLTAVGLRADYTRLATWLTLRGNGTTTPLHLNTTNMDFGTQPVATPPPAVSGDAGDDPAPAPTVTPRGRTRTLVLTNSDTKALTIKDISPVTPPFERVLTDTCADTLPIILTAGKSCTLVYRYAPTTDGSVSELVEITTNRNSQVVALYGQGSADVAQEPPPSLGTPVETEIPDLAATAPAADQPDESLQQLAVDSFGNRYLVGFSFNGRDYDIDLLKYDAGERRLWQRTIDRGNHDFGYALAINPADQSVYIGGYLLMDEDYQAVLLKYDSDGQFQWEQRYATGNKVNGFYDLAVDDGGVYAVGEHYNGRDMDALITRYSHDGELLWDIMRAGEDTESAYRVAVPPCADGAACTVLVAGGAGQNPQQGWIELRNASNGQVSSTVGFAEFAIEALALRPDGALVGGTDSMENWRVMQLDENLQTTQIFVLAQGGRLNSLAVAANGDTYAVGQNALENGDGLLLTLSQQGEVLNELRFDKGGMERFNALQFGPGGLLSVAGQRGSPGQGSRFLLLTIESDTDSKKLN